METIEVDEIPVNEEPAQVTDQIFVQEERTRVLEPEMHDSEPKQQEPARSVFDITKISFELQQGYRIYTELLSDSNRNVTWPFLEPVDADSLGLWDYYDRIKQPMCFSTSKYHRFYDIFSAFSPLLSQDKAIFRSGWLVDLPRKTHGQNIVKFRHICKAIFHVYLYDIPILCRSIFVSPLCFLLREHLLNANKGENVMTDVFEVESLRVHEHHAVQWSFIEKETFFLSIIVTQQI